MKKLLLVILLSISTLCHAALEDQYAFFGGPAVGAKKRSFIPGNGYFKAITSSSLPPLTTLATIATAQATYTSSAYLNGTIHYYCDCGTGSSGSCIAGSDTNSGLLASSPKQTIASAIATLNAVSNGDTVALCKGGAFNQTATLYYTNASCSAGSAGSPHYCFDLREYSSPSFSATSKPIINIAATPATSLSFTNGATGGLRVMNLDFEGSAGGQSVAALFLWNGATVKHDIMFANNTINNYGIGIQDAAGSSSAFTSQNVSIIGNTISNTGNGYLGNSNNGVINYNYMTNNGGATVFVHQIYLSGEYGTSNMQVKGNYLWGQYSATCSGTMIVVHGQFTGLDISNNYIGTDDTATTDGCWGIGVNQGYSYQEFFRSVNISGNTIINGGNTAIAVDSCPSCIIENNVIVGLTTHALRGIMSPTKAASVTYSSDANTANLIRNNTIYYGPNASGAIGIAVKTEGTGHIIANNSVSYSPSNAGSGVYCFEYGLPLTSYTFSNNNHCNANSAYTWELNHGSSLTVWRAYATSYGFDLTSIASAPSFTNAPTDFRPTIGSPLIGAGNNTYKSTLDLRGITRTSTPAIGAYEP